MGFNDKQQHLLVEKRISLHATGPGHIRKSTISLSYVSFWR